MLFASPLSPSPLPAAFSRFSLSHRAASIGVSEKLISMLTRMVADMVMPNDFRNRPTIPPMNAMGRNTAISESVMERTARPISLVAAKAALNGVQSFSSM